MTTQILLWPKSKILLTFRNKVFCVCEKSKNKGEKSEKIADLGSYPNQPSAEGLA